MKSTKSTLLIYYIMATLLIFAIRHIRASTEVPLELAIKKQLDREQFQHKTADNTEIDNSTQQILKRKRRYLEFPEGTSFQLVYDLIVGVVDYTNYLILGVTVALAWELPSKPPSEIIEDLTERLKDGSLGTSRNDTVENISYINKKPSLNGNKKHNQIYKYTMQPIFKPPMYYHYYYPNTPSEDYYRYQKKQTPLRPRTYVTNRQSNWPISYYYRPKQPHPLTSKKLFQKPSQYGLVGIKYPWWNLSQRLKNGFIKQQPSIRRFDQNVLQKNLKIPLETGRTEHRIYPVFGKRSVSNRQNHNETHTSSHFRLRRSGISREELSKWDRIHIEHHRKTRHELYQRIETYLNGRGANGHHCVLRALCETGQKSHEHKPGSFVGEIMRAMFTMPEPLDATTVVGKQIGHKEKRYDIANALQEDCASRYHLCKDSLWASHFVQ